MRPIPIPAVIATGIAAIVRRCERRLAIAALRIYRRSKRLATPLSGLLARDLLRSGRIDWYARVPEDMPPIAARLAAIGEDDVPAGFNPDAYLHAYPDLRVARVDPVRHVVAHGRREGRWPLPVAMPAPVPQLPHPAGDAPRAGSASKACVIVPVYGARAETLRCLAAVLAARSDVPHRLLVIDDGSPDPLLAADLDTLAATGRIVLLRNSVNLGFSATVNRGLTALRPGEDAVLLNSDTEPYDHWLDRLHRTAHGGPRVGTVTPLSNAATILSYPIRLRDNPVPPAIGWRGIDRVARTIGHAPVEVPTAIGFCMFIRADCLADIGLLDAAAFPRGYGEENDFCLRASANGWLHLAATDIFVAHAGGTSFGAERDGLIAKGLAVIDRRYPHYRGAVDRFIRADPLADVRRAIDCARIRQAMPGATLWHWIGAPPADAPVDALRLYRDPADGSLRIATDAMPTPNITDIFPSYGRMMLGGDLVRLGVARVRLRDRAWLGRATVALIRDAAQIADATIA